MKPINRTYRFISLALAFLVFFTSVGFTMDMHFCSGKLMSVSFFGKAESCLQMTEGATTTSCVHTQEMMVKNKGCSVDKKNCCANKNLHFQSNQVQNIQPFYFAKVKQFAAAFTAVFF